MARETSSRGASSASGWYSGMNRWPLRVAEVSPFAAQGLGQQVARRAGDVEHGRVELHELHVAQLGPGAVGHGVAVGGGDRRVGRLAVELPRPAGGQHHGPGPDEREPAPPVPDQDAPAAALVGQQVDGEAVLPDPDRPAATGPGGSRPA